MTNYKNDRICYVPFRPSERVLNSKHVSFVDKIEAIIKIWTLISETHLDDCNINELVAIVEWAKLHTYNVILRSPWNDFRDHYQIPLATEIEKSQVHLALFNVSFVMPCQRLLTVLKETWPHTIIAQILTDNENIAEPDIMNWFQTETPYLTSIRLMVLCESHCEDIALKIATAFINIRKLKNLMDEKMHGTDDQNSFIFDTFLALLFKYEHQEQMLKHLRSLSIETGLALVNRFMSKKSKRMKIWAAAPEIAKHASQIYITYLAYNLTEAHVADFRKLILNYHSICSSNEFMTTIRKISNITTRTTLEELCHILQSTGDVCLKHFLLDMYIKLLTTLINECECFKQHNDKVQAAVVTTELAKYFSTLSTILYMHVDVARECLMTAFSLEPTPKRFEMIEHLAMKSGFTVEELPAFTCTLHPPVLKTDELMWLCSSCGDWQPDIQLKRPPENNIILHQIMRTEVLGIPQSLCDDLSVCISYSRYQILSWYQPWMELHRICAMYLRDPVATKNFITDLKYIDIDYSVFQNIKKEPLDEWTGIEKGYERYLSNYDENVHQVDTVNILAPSTSTSEMKNAFLNLTPFHITADSVQSSKVLRERIDFGNLGLDQNRPNI